jgi:hypothetical protein
MKINYEENEKRRLCVFEMRVRKQNFERNRDEIKKAGENCKLRVLYRTLLAKYHRNDQVRRMRGTCLVAHVGENRSVHKVLV